MARRRHSTPEELDPYFDRMVIREEEYTAFWRAYWQATAQERRTIQRTLDDQLAARERKVQQAQHVPAPIVKDRAAATRTAHELGGTVLRLDRTGRPNARGRFYQAVPPARLVPGFLTTDRAMAERHAAAMGGHIVRRNAAGQFSARGRTFQAMPPHQRRKS